MRRKLGFAAAAALLLLVLGDAGYWRLAELRMRAGIAQWTADLGGQGWTVSSGTVTASGWPFSAVLALPDLRLRHAGPDLPGDVDIAAPLVTVTVRLLQPTMLAIDLGGTQRVRFGSAPPFLVSGAALRFTAARSRDGLAVVDFDGQAVSVERPDSTWHASAASIDAHAEPDPGPLGAITFSANAQAVALPPGVKWPLGASIASASVAGKLNGPMPADRDPAKWAAAWRDGGGSLEIERLAMEWGPLTLSSSATLALDDDLQPMGSGSAKASGYADALDRLAAASVLTKSAATVAKAVLSLLAGSADDEAAAPVEVPLTLQYRTLSMRQVPLARLPEVDWGGP